MRVRLREETNKAILQAAEQVFGAQGLGGARMEDIAANAGVAVGTLYNHFRDRDALLSELIASRREDLARRLDDELRRSRSEDFPRQLQRFIAAILTHFEEHRPFFSILLEGEYVRAAATARGKRPNEALAEVFKRVEQLVERGIAARELRNDSDLLSSFLTGLVRSVLMRELYVSRRVPAADRASEIVDFFLRGAGRR